MAWKHKPTGRSCACNGEKIRSHREARGWTQADLAQKSGYTERLIAKAEASESVRPDTLDTIAETLSTPENPVYPEDLASNPKELVLRFLRTYAEHERELVERCRDFIDDDIEVEAVGDPDIIPFAGKRSGIKAFNEFWQEFFDLFTRPDKKLAEKPQQITCEVNRVIAVVLEQVDVVGAPPQPPAYVTLVFDFERGKIVRFEDYFEAANCEHVLKSLPEPPSND